MNTLPIGVITPVGQAIDRVKQVLFRPFDLSRWFIIGFGAWLAGLGQRGGYNFRLPSGGHGNTDIHADIERACEYVTANLTWIVPLAVVIVAFLFCLGLLVLWLSSRGEFMFLHCVALNRAEVVVPWRRFRRPANSLFWFRLVIGLVNLAIILPLLVWAGLSAYRMSTNDTWDAGGILLLVGLGLFVILIGIFFGVVLKLTIDFVVPVMFLRGKSCPDGWRELLPLVTARFGSFVLYILFQIVLTLAIAGAVIAIVLITCCLAGCLMILPYVGTVTLLPLLVFKRAYSLYYFAQFGADFDAFAPAAQPLPAPIPPPTAPEI